MIEICGGQHGADGRLYMLPTAVDVGLNRVTGGGDIPGLNRGKNGQMLGACLLKTLVGAQLVTGPLEDGRLLALGAALERALAGGGA